VHIEKLTHRCRPWLGAALAVLLCGAVDAQDGAAGTDSAAPHAVAVVQPAQPEKAAPAATPPPPPALTAPAAPADVPANTAFGEPPSSASGVALASLSAPTMLGDLLGAGRSVRFIANRTARATFLNAVGSTSIVNPAVADNNSPVPQDRVYYRFNHFADAVAVTGASSRPPIPAPNDTLQAFSATRSYDCDLHTFGFEKTFFERRASLELRLPFATTLSSQLDLSYGRLTSNTQLPAVVAARNQDVFADAQATPEDSLGSTRTEFGNLTLIFKWLYYQRTGVWLSAGVAAGIPTGPNSQVRVTDFVGPAPREIDTLRFREFTIDNNTWSLSPFLAGLITPTDRLFAQGFVQYDAPLNTSAVTYSEFFRLARNADPQPGTPDLRLPFTVHHRLREQQLLHLDGGVGCWVLRRPQARCLTGLATLLELHYTTTLDDADIVRLPRDGTELSSNPGTPAPGPEVGNLRNRVDLLDLTAGMSFEFAQRARLATGVSVPLHGGDNRTYDWEVHMQLNYYFGAARGAPLPPAPNF
jgi:hypothetical protein